jgi:hypothetical protein
MSEIRTPDFIFLLKKQGKKVGKLELFDSEKWGVKYYSRNKAKKYRLRANGKWFPKGEIKYFSKWQVRDLLWKSIDL